MPLLVMHMHPGADEGAEKLERENAEFDKAMMAIETAIMRKATAAERAIAKAAFGYGWGFGLRESRRMAQEVGL